MELLFDNKLAPILKSLQMVCAQYDVLIKNLETQETTACVFIPID